MNIPSLQSYFKESRKQCGVTPHFSAGQNLLKKYPEVINIDTINRQNFLINPLTTNNAICRQSLTLRLLLMVQFGSTKS